MEDCGHDHKNESEKEKEDREAHIEKMKKVQERHLDKMSAEELSLVQDISLAITASLQDAGIIEKDFLKLERAKQMLSMVLVNFDTSMTHGNIANPKNKCDCK